MKKKWKIKSWQSIILIAIGLIECLFEAVVITRTTENVKLFLVNNVLEGLSMVKYFIIRRPFIMAREKKPVHKVQMTEGKRNIIHQLLKEYDIQSAEDIQDALKDLLGGTIKEMMEAEMDDHLGYEKSQRSDSGDYRNGYKRKRVNSRYGSMEIEVPQDRKSTF